MRGQRQQAVVTDADMAKLPARFRLHIQKLTNRIQELESAQAAQQETRVIVEPYEARMFLDDASTVRFMVQPLPSERPFFGMTAIDCTLRTPFGSGRDPKEAMLNVSCNSGTLVALPGAANQLYVGVR